MCGARVAGSPFNTKQTMIFGGFSPGRTLASAPREKNRLTLPHHTHTTRTPPRNHGPAQECHPGRLAVHAGEGREREREREAGVCGSCLFSTLHPLFLRAIALPFPRPPRWEGAARLAPGQTRQPASPGNAAPRQGRGLEGERPQARPRGRAPKGDTGGTANQLPQGDLANTPSPLSPPPAPRFPSKRSSP